MQKMVLILLIAVLALSGCGKDNGSADPAAAGSVLATPQTAGLSAADPANPAGAAANQPAEEVKTAAAKNFRAR